MRRYVNKIKDKFPLPFGVQYVNNIFLSLTLNLVQELRRMDAERVYCGFRININTFYNLPFFLINSKVSDVEIRQKKA